MAQFVTASIDFIQRPYLIPNQYEATDFSAWLTDNESQIMEDLLGWDLWEAFQAGLVPDYPDQKWEDIRDGAEYDYGGYTWKWAGLNKMLVPKLYSLWLSDAFDKHTNIGIGINQKADFNIISPALRISRSHNTFSRLAGGDRNYANSLYGFLLANYETDYTEWKPLIDWNDPGKMNVFDL
jgi:hypothetical protein